MYAHRCLGNGEQVLPATTPLTESDSIGPCARSCTTDANCQSGEMCYNGRCQIWQGIHCQNSGTLNYYGYLLSCGSYVCDPVQQDCFTACRNQTAECAPGLTCYPDETCH